MSEKPKYYITTAIAYTSGKPHIGNTYEILRCLVGSEMCIRDSYNNMYAQNYPVNTIAV